VTVVVIDDVADAARTARERLLAERNEAGVWSGELSTSALSTATATAALARTARVRPSEAARLEPLVLGGRAWLARHANDDGGFGDTVESPSNLSTTTLAWMALGPRLVPDERDAVARAHRTAEAWIVERLGGLDAPRLARALEGIYGDDKTFAAPILAACAIGDAFEDAASVWREVPRLPYELAALPQSTFRWLGLRVVSYALPALIAIGQAIDVHRERAAGPLARTRRATRAPTLRVLERIQPENGGFLEATPLTSFVLLSLASIGHAQHLVARRAAEFLVASVRSDGSWPIDTNLTTWATTLAVSALSGAGTPIDGAERVRAWLLDQQYREVHPYTGAAPGGWAWTDLPGGVPDADDTAGALLALRVLGDPDGASRRAALAGARWLRSLQNRDGGIPTFCRGWGQLPFDRSACDLTAHALRAWSAWHTALTTDEARRFDRASRRALGYLVRTQRGDGAWVPLWFGNQHEPAKQNPLYGTSRVLRAAAVLSAGAGARAAAERGLAWLLGAQHADGAFGGAPGLAPTIEETALGLEALCACRAAGIGEVDVGPFVDSAVRWLVRATDGGTRFEPSPIGLYFAQLWYSERLYPIVFTASALGRAARTPA